MSPIGCADGLERSLNISNPLEMLCVGFDHCKNSLQSPVCMVLEAV